MANTREQYLGRHEAAAFQGERTQGTRGRVVIIGGSPAMIGAARLAARSAFAAGAGLVHVVAPEEALQSIRVAEPDVQSLAHEFSGELSDAFITLIERADAIAIGPGLGRDAGRADFVLAVLAHVKRAVVDADALTVLKGRRDELAKLAATREIVCTPHIGEFRTLFGEFANDLETNPWDAAAEASASAHLTVLLKGVPTIVASPNEPMRTVAAGNPGLATGGSGDVLTGIITALLAQKLSAHDAAAVGAEAHGLAADNAARRTTARSMRPMDVINALPDVWRTWARPPIRPRIPILAELPAPRTI